jgi:hypothetical protein
MAAVAVGVWSRRPEGMNSLFFFYATIESELCQILGDEVFFFLIGIPS